MKTVIQSLFLCVGFYFILYSGRLILFRVFGYTSMFQILDTVFGYLPYVSAPVLFVIALLALNKRDWGPYDVLKVPSVILAAITPLLIDGVMYRITYFINPPARFWSLSISEWLTLFAGCFLMIIAITGFVLGKGRS